MPTLLVRSLNAETVDRLKLRARSHGRSLEGELRDILVRAAWDEVGYQEASASVPSVRTSPVRAREKPDPVGASADGEPVPQAEPVPPEPELSATMRRRQEERDAAQREYGELQARAESILPSYPEEDRE